MRVPQLAQPASLPAAEIDARVVELSGKIACNCGCGKKVVEKCYCGVANGLRDELRSQVTAGSTHDQVLDNFVQTYGEEILASPVPEGFNLTAWAAPFTALLLGIVLVGVLLSKWRRRSATDTGSTPALGSSPAATLDPYEEAFEAEYASRRD